MRTKIFVVNIVNATDSLTYLDQPSSRNKVGFLIFSVPDSPVHLIP